MFDREKYILEDTPLKKDLLKFFKKNEKLTIFDIGGCEGEESIRYSRLFPEAFIYIFEPLPNNQKLIQKNFLKYAIKNVKLIPSAVSNVDGTSDFHVSSGSPENINKELDWDFGNKSSSLLEPEKANINSWLKFDNKIKVNTITLKSFLYQNKISEIDFMHMDVQGAEFDVLKGSENYLHKIKAIWLEVAEIELYKNQVLRKDLENYMIDNGFYLVKYEREGNDGDQFYINKKYFKVFSLLSKIIYIKKK